MSIRMAEYIGRSTARVKFTSIMMMNQLPQVMYGTSVTCNKKTLNGLAIQHRSLFALLDRIIKASSNRNDIVLDAFCGCGTALVSAQNLGRQWIGIDQSPTACRVMAKRLRDVCRLHEGENYWRAGKGFVVRDLPWTEKQLRAIPPFEFENWAVIALGGIPNKVQVGDMGIDGRIYPIGSAPKQSKNIELDFMDEVVSNPSKTERQSGPSRY